MRVMANHTGEVYNLLHIQKEGGHTILMVSGTKGGGSYYTHGQWNSIFLHCFKNMDHVDLLIKNMFLCRRLHFNNVSGACFSWNYFDMKCNLVSIGLLYKPCITYKSTSSMNPMIHALSTPMPS